MFLHEYRHLQSMNLTSFSGLILPFRSTYVFPAALFCLRLFFTHSFGSAKLFRFLVTARNIIQVRLFISKQLTFTLNLIFQIYKTS